MEGNAKQNFQLQTPNLHIFKVNKEPRTDQNGENQELDVFTGPKNELQALFRGHMAL